MSKKFILSILVGLLLTVSTRGSVLTEGKDTPKNVPLRISSASSEEKCQILKDRISAKVALYDKNKDKHTTIYANIKTRVENIIKILKDKGVDTAKLDADLTDWVSKLTKLNDDYQSFISKLGETKDIACGSDNTAFVAKLDEAKALLKLVRTDTQDLRNFFETTIKKDIQTLRKTLPGNRGKDSIINGGELNRNLGKESSPRFINSGSEKSSDKNNSRQRMPAEIKHIKNSN